MSVSCILRMTDLEAHSLSVFNKTLCCILAIWLTLLTDHKYSYAPRSAFFISVWVLMVWYWSVLLILTFYSNCWYWWWCFYQLKELYLFVFSFCHRGHILPILTVWLPMELSYTKPWILMSSSHQSPLLPTTLRSTRARLWGRHRGDSPSLLLQSALGLSCALGSSFQEYRAK